MRGPRLNSLVLVSCCCALASLSIAVLALAGGRDHVYIGPIDQVDLPGPGGRNEGSIELIVHRQHHRDGTTTAEVVFVRMIDVNLHCENGEWVGAGLPAGGKNTVLLNSHGVMEIKRGSFSEPKGYGDEGERVGIKGTVSAHTASGTLKMSLYIEPQESDVVGGPIRRPGICRSGTLHWSAGLTH